VPMITARYASQHNTEKAAVKPIPRCHW
jgi:hypothetical protein